MQYKHIPMKYDLPEVGIAKGQTEVGGVGGGGVYFLLAYLQLLAPCWQGMLMERKRLSLRG